MLDTNCLNDLNYKVLSIKKNKHFSGQLSKTNLNSPSAQLEKEKKTILLTYHHSTLIFEALHPPPPPNLTEHLVLHRAVRVIQMQEELLKEELQMRSTELRVVVFGHAGQPQAHSLQGNPSHLFTAVVQTLQQLCGQSRQVF